MNKITFKEVVRQLKNDAFGKDAFRGVTFSYSWLCNQFGHFSFGFLIAFFAHKSFITFSYFTFITYPVETAALVSTTIVFLFEMLNYRITIYGWRLRKRINQLFDQDRKNLIWDLFTDLCFFVYGAFIFYLADTPEYSWEIDIYLVALFLSSLFLLGRKWYLRKMYQQHAYFPFQLRLGQIKGNLSKKVISEIETYRDDSEEGEHLVIFGSLPYENNGMAVAIGNEFAIKREKVYYTVMANFLAMQYDSDEVLLKYKGKNGIWTWRQAKYVVVDHIQAGDSSKPWITPDEVYLEVNNPKYADKNISAIKTQNIIWVVGDIPDSISAPEYKQSWVSMLEQLGVKQIRQINLNEKS